MNLQRKAAIAAVWALSVIVVSCMPGSPGAAPPIANRFDVVPAAGYPIPIQARFPNISIHQQSGNPCADGNFRPPVYEFDNLTISKYFRNENDPEERFWFSTVNFTLRDVANNNRSFHCQWGPRNPQAGRSWETQDCTPDTGPVPDPSRAITLLNLWPENILMNKSDQDPLRLVEYWYCDIANGSYPDVYQSRAELFLDVTCPDRGRRDTEYPCVVSTLLPVSVKAQWQPRGALPGTPKLVPRPRQAPPPAVRGLGPLPETDCTAMSFTHPEWELSKTSYIPWRNWGGNYTAGTVKLSLKSRTTGNQVQCQFGGPNAREFEEFWVLECFSDSEHPEHDSVFSVEIYMEGRVLIVREDWVCGHVNGSYSTNFSATSTTYLTIYPADSTSSVYTSEPITIKGTLTKPVSLTPAAIPPPPGSTNPGCLATSQRPGGDVWTATRFLYQTTTLNVTSYAYRGGYPLPWNRTLAFSLRNEATGITQSCVFNDPVLDNPVDRWWRCGDAPNPHSTSQRPIDTYIHWNSSTSELRFNQTWYCNDNTPSGRIAFQISGEGSLRPRYDSDLLCGSSVSTVYGFPCPSFFAPNPCDVTLSARWCSLRADREGRGAATVRTVRPVALQRLPDNALTSPDPDPTRWSCTVASLGRGPVVWTLRARDYLAVTAWFGHWKSDQTYTKLRFDLGSSVFRDRPDDDGRGGVVRNVGIQSTYSEYGAGYLTPWLRGFDPTATFRSPSRGSYSDAGGLDFYNVLDWQVRFDVTTGYMELNHSWYCDDKDPSRPIIFNGTWNGYIPLNCTYKFGSETPELEDGIVCLPVGGDIVATPVVTHYAISSTIPDP